MTGARLRQRSRQILRVKTHRVRDAIRGVTVMKEDIRYVDEVMLALRVRVAFVATAQAPGISSESRTIQGYLMTLDTQGRGRQP